MKKSFSLFVLLFSFLAISWGQDIYSDSIFLKNGSVIRGWMMNKTTKGDVWMKTSNNKTIKIKANEIEKLKVDANVPKMEEITPELKTVGNHQWGVRVGANVPKIEEITPELKTVDNHHWGVRVGALFSRTSNYTKMGSGAHLGGVFELSLDKQQKWFMQMGLDFQFRTEKYTEGDKDDYVTSKTNTLHMEIPLMFSYKMHLNNITIYPSFGIAYSLGLCGKYHYSAINNEWGDIYKLNYSKYVFYNPNRDESDYDEYSGSEGDYGVVGSLDRLRRNWLVKLGVNAEIKDFYVGIEAFTNIYNIVPVNMYAATDWYENQFIFNGIKVSVGCNF